MSLVLLIGLDLVLLLGFLEPLCLLTKLLVVGLELLGQQCDLAVLSRDSLG